MHELLALTHHGDHHYRRDEMVKRIKLLGFAWNNMQEECQLYIQGCEIC